MFNSKFARRRLGRITSTCVLALAVGAVLGSSATASASPNLVVNGSFEGGTSPWTQTGAGVDLIGEPTYQVQAGVNAIDLNSNKPGGVVQTLITAHGGKYILSYWMAANAYDPGFCQVTPPKPLFTMKVQWDGKTIAENTFDPNGTFGGEPLSQKNMGWTNHTVNVTGGKTGSDALAFISTMPKSGFEACGPTLDNVVVSLPAAPPPTVTKLAPAKGPAAGGTTVVITGKNLAEVTAVKFGGVSATEVKNISPTSVSAVSPAATAKTVDVSVTTASGVSVISSADHFKYGPPTVASVTANTGPIAGGNEVTVKGSGFGLGTEATLLKFGSTEATEVNCSSMTTCTVVVPSHVAGAVDVTATVSAMSSLITAPADRYTYN